jgi:uncharacterized protein YecE (DUF72 family)
MIYIGTSGWHYNHWKGKFYPRNLDSGGFLSFYIKKFNTVEINNTFYQIPKRDTFIDWESITPDDFIFAIKASRYITHLKKLNDTKASIKNFFDGIKYMKHKVGPILFQLPPNWASNSKRLENFIKVLPANYRYAFEFRNLDWFKKEIYEILSGNNIAFCIYELGKLKSPKKVTADFVYIRLHGPNDAYKGLYSSQRLNALANDIKKWQRQNKDVFCYFDNDENAYAPKNASSLLKIIKE